MPPGVTAMSGEKRDTTPPSWSMAMNGSMPVSRTMSRRMGRAQALELRRALYIPLEQYDVADLALPDEGGEARVYLRAREPGHDALACCCFEIH